MWKIINVKWSHFLASRPCTWRRKIFPQLFVTRCAETRKRNVLSAQRGRKQIMKFSIVWHICCKRWGRWHEILQQYYGRLFCEMQNLNHKTCEVSIPLKQYLFFFPLSLCTVHFCFTENDATTHLNSMFITGFAYSQGNYILGNYIITQIIF